MEIMSSGQLGVLCEEIAFAHLHRADSVGGYVTLVDKWFMQIVNENGTFHTKTGEGEKQMSHVVKLSNGRFHLPDSTSDVAMKFGLSHRGELLVDVDYKVYGGGGELRHEERLEGHLLVQIPVPLLPGLGMHTADADSSGTYIIGGKPRFLPPIKAVAYNFPIRMHANARDCSKVQVRSSHLDRCNRSTSTIEFFVESGTVKKGYHQIFAKVPFGACPIPIILLVKFMGMDVFEFVGLLESMVGDEVICGLYRLDMLSYLDVKEGECVEQVSRLYGKGSQVVEQLIRNEVFPHLKGKLGDKMEYMAMCIAQLVMFRDGKLKETDRDSRCFSRVACAVTTTVSLCRISLLNFEKQAVKMIRKCSTGGQKLTISRILSHERLSKRVNSAFATGTWSAKRPGVTQALQTNNLYTISSQMRRLNSSCLHYEGSHVAARLLHPSQAGYECQAETPEGQGIGMISALASTCSYTGDTLDLCMSRELSVIDVFSGVVPIFAKAGGKGWYRIHGEFGRIAGYVEDLVLWNAEFHRCKLRLEVDPYLTYYIDHDSRDWYLFADRGRMIRPLLVLSEIYKLSGILRESTCGSFLGDIIAHGCIEYTCPGMEDDLCVATDIRQGDLKSKTHLEISGASLFGIIAAQTVFFRHNQAPRLVYACAMQKQCITQHDMRNSGGVCDYTLWYGSRPLCYTKTARIANTDILPDVTNVTVLVLPMSAGQEDAIVFNKAGIDCGMFTHAVRRAYSADNSKHTHFTNPANQGSVAARKQGDYSALDSGGMPIVGRRVKGGDILIGRMTDVKQNALRRSSGGEEMKIIGEDNSITLKEHEKGFVHRLDIATTPRATTVTVHVTDHAEVEVGDKFASRHSQKGVCGQIRNREDMPFSLMTGMSADVVVSPLGFPSRMTMGKLIELIIGKVVCITGDSELGEDKQDFFESFDAQMAYFKGLLKKHGFKSNGTEVFINGQTGERIRGQVFAGVAAYHKLKHLASAKIHVRSTGPVQALTRQPNEGRRQGGGMRFGAMEFECVQAHAASEVLRERTLTASDDFQTHICDKCGQLAEGNVHANYSYCRKCETSDHVKLVPISYTTKLLIQELAATGINVSVYTKKKRKRDTNEVATSSLPANRATVYPI